MKNDVIKRNEPHWRKSKEDWDNMENAEEKSDSLRSAVPNLFLHRANILVKK